MCPMEYLQHTIHILYINDDGKGNIKYAFKQFSSNIWYELKFSATFKHQLYRNFNVEILLIHKGCRWC